MKLFYLAIALLVALPAFGQSSITNAVPVDFRYNLFWEDPNAAGEVSLWNVSATNATTVSVAATRITEISIESVLYGLPPGKYSLSVIPISQFGVLGNRSTNYWVHWPGRKNKAGHGLGSRK